MCSTYHRQSWPTRVDVHQDVSDGLGGPTISLPGGPQSPARSAESLHRGPRPKTALLDLGQRPAFGQTQERGPRLPVKPHINPLRLGSLTSVGPGKTRSPSLFSVEEDEEEDDKPSSLPAQVVLRAKAPSSSSGNRLTSRMSAPVLNQIHEEDKEEEEQQERRELHGFGPPKPSLSLNLNPRPPSPTTLISSPKTVTLRAPVAVFTPSAETSDDETESHHELDTTSVDGDGGEREESKEGGENRESSPSNCASPGSLSGQGKAKAASGLVESLKLMSLCLSSQFHNLTGGGGGGGEGGGVVVAGDTQDRPMWRMCMGGSTGSLDKVSLLGGPSPRGNLYHQQPALGDPLGDPLLDGPHSGTLRLGELDLARENHRNMKNRVLQRPLSDKTLSVNIHRGPKEGLLCTPTPHSCCQVI